MKISDVKSGMTIRLKNGFTGVMHDNNGRGRIRMVLVNGYATEMGSVYATDIVAVQVDGVWQTVQHTEAQNKSAKMRAAFGF